MGFGVSALPGESRATVREIVHVRIADWNVAGSATEAAMTIREILLIVWAIAVGVAAIWAVETAS